MYTRIVGYYRSLRNWNKGKKEEYRERILFHIPEDDAAAQPGKAQPGTDEIAEYRYFFRKTCPRCPSVKEYVSTLPLSGESVDVDTEEGMNEAQSLHILSTPTVVFFDRDGRPIHEAHSVEQLENLRLCWKYRKIKHVKRTFGLQKTSLIDYPGKVACVLFSRGCNLRCPYCHNPELVEGPEPEGMESWEEILRFLSKRKNVLEGVCISGGEPLLIKELPDLIREIHSLPYFVKVDTNGTNPQGLEKLEADYVAMDFKTSPEKYSLVGGSPETSKAVCESARILIERKIPHEFRITVAPEIFEETDARTIARILKGMKTEF